MVGRLSDRRGKGWAIAFGAAAVALLLGVIAGMIVASGMSGGSDSLSALADDFLAKLPVMELDYTAELEQALLANGKFLLLIWFCGLSLLAIPLALAALFFRGFALGFTVSYMIGRQMSQGLLVTILGILPQNILLLPTFMIAGGLALLFSVSFWRGGINKRNLAFYSGASFLLFPVVAVAAWLQGYGAPFLLTTVFQWLH